MIPRAHALPRFVAALLVFTVLRLAAAPGPPFPGTTPLSLEGDLAARMVGGIDAYLDRVLASAPTNRARHWHRDLSSPEAYVRSIATNRDQLRRILGVVDKRDPARLRVVAPVGPDGAPNGGPLGSGDGFRIFAVTWNVFRGVEAEGLLLVPDGVPVADVVALPDCDWSPEQVVGLAPGVAADRQFPRRLAENGCRVLVPFLIDRSDTNSGLPGVRKIRQSQREVLWRAAYEMGRTVQGYEIQKVLAAVDFFASGATTQPIAVIGYGEGGMIALYAGALDERVRVTCVSGFFPNQRLHMEPIYRNVWSISDMFAAGELAGLIAPRRLIWESGLYPTTEYPEPGQSHDGAAPGRLAAIDPVEGERELARAKSWLAGVPGAADFQFMRGEPTAVFGDAALGAFLGGPDVKRPLRQTEARVEPGKTPPGGPERALRQYSQILEDTQWLMREGEFTRREFWKKADRKDATTFAASANYYREQFLDEIVGPIPKASLPANPRSRFLYETNGYRGYEVVLDVHPDVFAYGILLVPNGIKPGERRPVVVCQHGLEGRPSDVANPDIESPYYHRYACQLAQRGFVTFAPQNPYIGQNRFRQVLRKAQPLKLTLWSFIMRQHEVILDWLGAQEFVDPTRMAFYGLSYGGKTAMRIPALLDRYCLSICSADYNEWIWKNVSIRSSGYCYLYGGEYDMPEFNLGNTFNYAELSWLILPRPFMVERGHDDGVAPDEWVAYEFAKTRRQYVKLGLGDRTEIEFFDGPHTINGKGTFDFLHKHLNWSKPRP